MVQELRNLGMSAADLGSPHTSTEIWQFNSSLDMKYFFSSLQEFEVGSKDSGFQNHSFILKMLFF